MEKEAKHCSYKCDHNDCSAEATAVCDQIVFGTTNNKIRQEAFVNSYRKTFQLFGRKACGWRVQRKVRVSTVLDHINARASETTTTTPAKASHKNLNPITCFNYGTTVTTPIRNHVQIYCPAVGTKCDKCNNTGHFQQFCKKCSDVQQLQTNDQTPPLYNENTYNINIFHIDTTPQIQHKTIQYNLTPQNVRSFDSSFTNSQNSQTR